MQKLRTQYSVSAATFPVNAALTGARSEENLTERLNHYDKGMQLYGNAAQASKFAASMVILDRSLAKQSAKIASWSPEHRSYVKSFGDSQIDHDCNDCGDPFTRSDEDFDYYTAQAGVRYFA